MKRVIKYLFVFLISFSMLGISGCEDDDPGIPQETKEKITEYYNNNAKNFSDAVFESYTIVDEEIYTYLDDKGEIIDKNRTFESSTYDKENYKYSNRKLQYDKDDNILSSYIESAKEDEADFDVHFNIGGVTTKVPPAYVDIKVKELYVTNHASKFVKFYNLNAAQIELFVKEELNEKLISSENAGRIIKTDSSKIEFVTLENEVYMIKVNLTYDSYNVVADKMHEYSYTETYSYKFNKNQFINFSSDKKEVETYLENDVKKSKTKTITRNIDYTTSFDNSLYKVGGTSSSTPLTNKINIYLDYTSIGSVNVLEDTLISDILSSYDELDGVNIYDMKCYDVYCNEKYNSNDTLELFGKPMDIFLFTAPEGNSKVYIKYTKSVDGEFEVFESNSYTAGLGTYEFELLPNDGPRHYLYDDTILVNGEEILSNSFNIESLGVYVVTPVLEITSINANERPKVNYIYRDILLGQKEIDKENMHILDFIDSDITSNSNNFSFIPYKDKELTQPFEFNEILGRENVNIYFDIVRNNENCALILFDNLFDNQSMAGNKNGHLLSSIDSWSVHVGSPKDYQKIMVNGKNINLYNEFKINNTTGILSFADNTSMSEFIYVIVVQ